MGEDLGNHRRVFNGGDDCQGPATVRAVFDVDIEYPFESSSPVHAPSRAVMRGPVRIFSGVLINERSARRDQGTDPGVGRERAVEPNEVESGPWHQGG